MSRVLSDAEMVTLESLVDLTSMPVVIEALADIAGYKADHIRENWQDRPLGRAWDSMASKLRRFASTCPSL